MMIQAMYKTEKYILFIDESGKSKLSDQGDIILLCGFVINKDLHTALSSYMVSLKENSKISPAQNIHAFDIFEDEFKNLNKRVRREKWVTYSQIDTFFERLNHLLQGTEMQYLTVQLDKTIFQSKIEKRAKKLGITGKPIIKALKKAGLQDFIYEGLARKLILEFAHFLEQKDAQGEIIAESRRNDDTAVLNAFVDATQTSKYEEGTVYNAWSKQAFSRIHSLTFQNKRGLSFGLEIADLLAWTTYNLQCGRKNCHKYSDAHNRRVDVRLESIKTLIEKSDTCLLKKRGWDAITEAKFKTVAGDRVSEFTKVVNEYKPI